MKITIITACWNSISTINDAIESVKRQKLPDGVELEHLIIDGGSDDGTERLATLSEKDRGMYDALNKGIRMASGDVVGLLNADDVLAEDDTIAKIAAAFADPTIDGTYGDVRFVRADVRCTTTTSDCNSIRKSPPVRYCSGKWFRPWMFRFGIQTAHPSTFFRKECFAKWGDYSLDYGMYGDFELLCRFIWKNKAKMKYLPICTTVMRMGGASTAGWRSNVEINREDLRALRAHGIWSCLPLIHLKYLFKIWGFVFKRD